MTGGTLRGSNYALVGSGAEQSLQGLRVTRAFLSGSGLTAERGLSTSNMLSASVDRALVQAAAEVVVLADHTKLGHDYFARFAELADVALLITDVGADEEVTAGWGQVDGVTQVILRIDHLPAVVGTHHPRSLRSEREQRDEGVVHPCHRAIAMEAE